ncbi:hypothetical protein V3C99_018392 [Haemonchus contortus]|uniref:Transcriptional regulator n=1 Tax=Haemonchus contortus TaxID=6289 RepID=A0A7I4Z548_HAECO
MSLPYVEAVERAAISILSVVHWLPVDCPFRPHRGDVVEMLLIETCQRMRVRMGEQF